MIILTNWLPPYLIQTLETVMEGTSITLQFIISTTSAQLVYNVKKQLSPQPDNQKNQK